MYFMNEYDVKNAYNKFYDHAILGPAATTLANLMEWANDNSDGWHSWPKPARAAEKLMRLLDVQITQDVIGGYNPNRQEVTAAEVRKALVPIRAFRTRQGADFEVVSP